MFEVVQSPWQAKIADQITGDEEHELAPQARIRYSWPGMSRNAVSDAVDNALRLAVPATCHPAKVESHRSTVYWLAPGVGSQAM
jgi:hypothetical protein